MSKKIRPCITPGGKSEDTTWATPPDLFQTLDQEFHFICDVAALPHNTKCASYITPQQNALQIDWPRGPCWLNPPYGKELEAFIRKSLEQSRLGSTVVALVPVRSSNQWWFETIPHATEVRFIRGRVQFVGATQLAPFPSAVIVFTPQGGPPKLQCVNLPRGNRKKKK